MLTLNKKFKVCVKYKILIKLFIYNYLFCAHMLYVCGDTIQVEMVVLCVLFSLYSKHLYALATLLLGKELLVFNKVGLQKNHSPLPGVKLQLLGQLGLSLGTVKISNICKRT
jgi:hypothetical protein